MVIEEPKPKPKTEEQEQKTIAEIAPEFKAITDKIDKENMDNYTSQFDRMVHSPEWQLKIGLDTEPETFHYKIQSHENIKKRKVLEKEDIDENEDWDKYVENYWQRSQLLIQDMTRQQFDELPFYDVENLVTAWSVRSRRGFC